MPSIIVVGTQWGDEGKGKIVDVLAAHADCIIRAQGGHNAGHTVLIGQNEYKLHLIPSGILHPHTKSYLGAGVVIDPKVLSKEIKMLENLAIKTAERLFVSESAHVILPYHQYLDKVVEEKKRNEAIGTTLSGIGPCYADQINRIGLRIADFMDKDSFKEKLILNVEFYNTIFSEVYQVDPLDAEQIFNEYAPYIDFLKPYVLDWENWPIYEDLKSGKTVLLEGAQGTYLDINYGTYPFVTSSNTIASGICTGSGIGPKDIDEVIGITKAYSTRVGAGPMPTAFEEVENFPFQTEARELGTTTGRLRRMGWLDLPLVKQAVELNSLTSIALTKLDILDQLKTIKLCIGYELDGKKFQKPFQNAALMEKAKPIYKELKGWKSPTTHIKHYSDLPKEAQNYIDEVEKFCLCPINIVSVGPERLQTIKKGTV